MSKRPRGRPKVEGAEPERMTSFKLPVALVKEAQTGAYLDRCTLTAIVEQSLHDYVSRCRLKYNRNQPLPEHADQLQKD